MGKTLNKKILSDIEIPLPPLPIQKHIAKVLDTATKIVELHKTMPEELDTLAQSVFYDMFGDPVLNEKGWLTEELSSSHKIITGNTPSRKSKDYYGDYLEWIKSDNINTPYMVLTEATEYLSKKGAEVARIVHKGSILMTCIAGSLSCIGNVAIANRTVSFNQQINAIVPSESNNSLYLYWLFNLSKPYIQSQVTMSLKGIINKTNLSKPNSHSPLSLSKKLSKKPVRFLLSFFKLYT